MLPFLLHTPKSSASLYSNSFLLIFYISQLTNLPFEFPYPHLFPNIFYVCCSCFFFSSSTLLVCFPNLQIYHFKATLKLKFINNINLNNMLSLKKSLLVVCILGFIFCQEEQEAGHTQQVHLTVAQIWGFGILAGIGISLIGFLAAIILLVAKKCCHDSNFVMIIKFFFSLAFGALIGDSIVHILSEAYQSQLTDKKIVSLIFIISIVSFILIDRLMHAYGISHNHWVNQLESGCHDHDKKENKEQGHKHGHHHEHDHNCEGGLNPENMGNEQTSPKKQNWIKQSKIGSSGKIAPDDESIDKKNIENNGLKEQQKSCCQSLTGKESAGYMNLLGSFIHNFIDGLALGVAFATGNPLEIVPVIIAIIAHEIPRELGDVAILLKSKFTGAQTILCNGVVNFVSLIGVIIGLAVVNLSQIAKTYIMVYVAGNFVYIAADIWQNLFKNKGEGSKCKNFIEFVGAAVGIGSMFALTYLQAPEAHNH